jgi:hypothetical protein
MGDHGADHCPSFLRLKSGANGYEVSFKEEEKKGRREEGKKGRREEESFNHPKGGRRAYSGP